MAHRRTSSEGHGSGPPAKKPRVGESSRKVIIEKPSSSSGHGSTRIGRSHKIKRPTLLKQLQDILRKYPDDSQILRELIQNAEDAGAKTIKICFVDQKFAPSGEPILDKYFQGPGLIVFNDAEFTEKDWDGITTICDSGKEKDPFKVGKFGLGFKSVFHITDSPVIISGTNMLILDPLKSQKEEEECLTITFDELRELPSIKKTVACIYNRFGFGKSALRRSYQGTLLWFPFRRTRNDLCKTVYTKEKWRILITSFEAESLYNLIFLRNIEKVEVFDKNDNEPEFTVTITGINRESFQTSREKFREDIQRATVSLPPNGTVISVEAVITKKCQSGEVQRKPFLVVHCLRGTKFLTTQMSDLCEELHFSPLTGVAFCTEQSTSEKSMLTNGHLFCFLPLPLSGESLTGLPVHLNGFFDLEDNRRYIKLPVANNKETAKSDSSLMWNECILNDLLPHSYVLLIQSLIEISKNSQNTMDLVHNVYNSVPNPDDRSVKPDWKPLARKVCENLIMENQPCFFTKKNKGKWLPLSESVFPVFTIDIGTHVREAVENFLLDCGENVVVLSKHITSVLLSVYQDLERISPDKIRTKLKSAECYKSYPIETKMLLLEFILSDKKWESLSGIELLPLDNKSYVQFLKEEEILYVVTEKESRLFPGLDSKIISPKTVSRGVWSELFSMADKDQFQLKKLDETAFKTQLQGVFRKFFQRHEDKSYSSPKMNFDDAKNWIQRIWQFITERHFIVENFHSMPLIPLLNRKKQEITHKNQRKEDPPSISFHELNGKYLWNVANQMPSAGVLRVLKCLGVKVIQQNETIDFINISIEGYIKRPNAKSVLGFFNVAKGDVSTYAALINRLPQTDREELYCYLERHVSELNNNSDAHPILQAVNMFKQHNNIGKITYTSLSGNKMIVSDFTLPKNLEFSQMYIYPKYYRVCSVLGAELVKEKKCLRTILACMRQHDKRYKQKEKASIALHVAKREDFIELLSDIKQIDFMKSSLGTFCRPVDLFDPKSKILKKMFSQMKGTLPDNEFLKNFPIWFLKQIGMKTEDDVTSDDVYSVAKTIERVESQSTAYALMEVLTKYDKLTTDEALANLQNIKWLHFRNASNIFITPCTGFYRPTEVKSLSFNRLCGSVVPIVNIERVPKKMAEFYNWNKPPANDVILRHMKKVSSLHRERPQIELTRHIITMLEHLSKQKLTDQIISTLSSMHCIPTKSGCLSVPGNCFVQCEDLQTYTIEPYLYEISDDVRCLANFLIKLGVKQTVDLHCLKTVILQIEKEYKTTNKDIRYLKKDRKLVYNILKNISEMNIEQSQKEDLLVPIDVDETLVFKQAKECTYGLYSSTSGKLRNMMSYKNSKDEMEIFYVHRDIETMAPDLGIMSIKKRFILSEHCIPLPWGQKEVLTDRISDLLDGYSDGMAVLKELVQNAEDAGATKISFLYDERDNSTSRNPNLLLDSGMIECQGQALWVYNNALFKESDFANLIQLGGKTKMQQVNKIGKFGLGFCAVYNLTDVPSVLSRNMYGVLDPHCHHLGEAIIDNNPGIRLPLSNQMVMGLNDQFQPFKDVFRCDIQSLHYEGTLFRFPLRTKKQAISEKQKIIKDKKEYSKHEMMELLKKFQKSLGDLLLFTSKIKEISFYHLHPNGKNPDKEMRLLFQASSSCDTNLNPTTESIEFACVNHTSSSLNFRPYIKDIKIVITKEWGQFINGKGAKKANTLSWLISKDLCGASVKTFSGKVGDLPLSAVAVPVERKNSKITRIVELKDVTVGFSDTCRLFCFFPLPHPPNTKLSLHIHASFMAEVKRGKIVSENTDNKDNQNPMWLWNKTLLSDGLVKGFLRLLEYLANNDGDGHIEGTPYWILWPKASKTLGEEASILSKAFYDSIPNRAEKILYRESIRGRLATNFQGAIFLEPSFRYSEVGDIAFYYLMAFYDGVEVAMDLPKEIYDNLIEENGVGVFHDRIISKKTFYEKYFFPNLKTCDDLNKRNILIKEALCEESLYDTIKANDVIPANGKLLFRKPADLVDESGPLADMFEVTDGRFLCPKFYDCKKILKQLGMMTNILTSQILMERVSNVRTLERSHAVLRYLNRQLTKHLDVLNDIRSEKFLFLLRRPKEWPCILPWKKSTKKKNNIIARPLDLFSPFDKNLVGCIEFVADVNEGDVSENVLREIGMKQVSANEVISQATCIANLGIKSSIGIEEILEPLYRMLSDEIRNKSNDSRIKDAILSLSIKPFIRIGTALVEPCRVAKILRYKPCDPFLYEMGSDLNKEEYEPLWEILGIQKTYRRLSLLEVLHEVAERSHSLTPQLTKSYINMLANLHVGEPLDEGERAWLKIPDKDCCLRSLDSICYAEDDDDDLEMFEDETVYLIHDEITPHVRRFLGIMSKRHLLLTLNSDEIPFGQHEKLVTRLQNLLRDYPKDTSVLNELLQNADDAQAKQIHFVLDLRNHGTSKIFSKNWRSLQGPALCVFNDARFTEDDLEGIQNLGIGSKSEDSTKTGQFGVGFNAVYHITDAPSFLSCWKNEDGNPEGTCCVFDPQCLHLVVREDKPGRRFTLEKLKSKYADNYHCYLQDILPTDIGTWFRLPLRSDKQSKISSNIVTEQNMKYMLDEMKREMRTSILFLKNISRISISVIEHESAELTNTFSVHAEMNEKDYENLKCFHDIVKEEAHNLKQGKSILDMKVTDVKYSTNIQDTNGKIEKWLFVQTFGIPDSSLVPELVQKAIADSELNVLPLGGTAIRIESNELVEVEMINGKVFSGLPLPLLTGFPCHINGCFSVYSNRNEILGIGYLENPRSAWNRLLLHQTVPYSYASCLQYTKEVSEKNISITALRQFFSYFPVDLHDNRSLQGNRFKEVALAVFKYIATRNLELFPVCPEYSISNLSSRSTRSINKPVWLRWLPLNSQHSRFQLYFDNLVNATNSSLRKNKNAYADAFNSLYGDKEAEYDVESTQRLRTTLVDLGLKLVCTPAAIYETIISLLNSTELHLYKIEGTSGLCNIEDQVLTPKAVLEFLHSWNSNYDDRCQIHLVNIPLYDTPFGDIFRFINILEYCICNDEYLRVRNDKVFPFIVNNTGDLALFSNRLILSKFCNLLPKSSTEFIHKKLIRFASMLTHEPFQKLTIETLCSKLDKNISGKFKGISKQSLSHGNPGEMPNAKWIKELWYFLETVEYDKVPLLDQWCLLSLVWEDNKKELILFKHSYALMECGSFESYPLIQRILSTMNLPAMCELVEKSKHKNNIVASESHPTNFVRFLIYHGNDINRLNLREDECYSILSFIAKEKNRIVELILKPLRNLKLFVSINNDTVRASAFSRVLVIDKKNSSFDRDGLNIWAQKTSTLLMEYKDNLEPLYNVFGFTICSSLIDEHALLEFYHSYLLPEIDRLPITFHEIHLRYVRDSLLNGECTRLKKILPSIRFIPANHGDAFLLAKEFYNPHNTALNAICTQFPPSPFCDDDWEKFMLMAGVIDHISKGMFIEFAKQVEQKGATETTMDKSEKLVHHLFSQGDFRDDCEFLKKISKINFLVPFDVPSEYRSIYQPAVQSHLISFEHSVPQKHYKLLWTEVKLLPSYAVKGPKKMNELLGMNLEPEIGDIVNHMEKIFSVLEQDSEKSRNTAVIEDLMITIYEYITKQLDSIDDSVIERLKSIPLVHVKLNTFLQAKNIVLKESENVEIEPYLLVGSERYGKYNDFFRRLGATDKITLDHYVRVLAKLKAVRGSLSDQELRQTELAFHEILRLLMLCLTKSEIPVISEDILYLLSADNVLVPSTGLIFPDDHLIRQRLSIEKSLLFLKNTEQFEKAGYDVLKLITSLPGPHQLQILSEIVTETLDENNVCEVKVDVAVKVKMEKIVKNDFFLHCMVRLAKSANRSNKVSENIITEIKHNFQSLKVVCLEEVFTVLQHKGKTLQGGKTDCPLFFDEQEKVLYIQYSDHDFIKWIRRNMSYMAVVVHKLCHKIPSLEHIQTVLSNFDDSTENELETLLDKIGIVKHDFVPSNESWAAEPGTRVPPDLIPLLVQSIETFKVGETAVYEVFDNIHDDNVDCRAAVYIYVKIVDVFPSDDQSFTKYDINIGDDHIERVRSFQLYQIHRKPSHAHVNETTDVVLYENSTGNIETPTGNFETPRNKTFEQIIEEIEETLIKAWRLGKGDFKKVLRRLLLQWHPDKNGNSKESNEITKHLINFAKALEAGKIDINKSFQERKQHRERNKGSDFKWWRSNKRTYRKSDNTYDWSHFAENTRRNYSRYEETFTNNSTYHPDPQPHMVTVWYTQAQNDLTAAKTLYESKKPKMYNWVCALCHQAAEKAIKSLQVKEDGNKVKKHHSLLVSITLRNPRLREAAEKLESLVGHYTRMRYPYESLYPRGPSDLYNREHAKKAIDLAEIILDEVNNMMRV